EKARVKAQRAKLAQKAPEDVSGPPKLRRAPNSQGDSSSAPTQTGQTTPSQKPAPNSGDTAPNAAPSDSRPKLTKRENSDAASDGSSTYVDAPDRPTLRHQAPEES